MPTFQNGSISDALAGEPERLSQTVVEAVAAVEDCDPIDLPALFHSIDPDALDRLFDTRGPGAASGAPDGCVGFTYHGYPIRAYADGRVTVDQS